MAGSSPVLLAPWLAVVLAAVAGWLVKLAIDAMRVSRALGRLPQVPVPPELGRSARDAGIQRIVCFEGAAASAFCAGMLRPAVFISSRAVADLTPPELAAVLHHEAEHARRREPIVRAAGTAAADVLAFLPIVRWWSQRRSMRAELRADEIAERYAGRPALAGALLTMAEPAFPVPAFAGQMEVRARRLLGLKVEEPPPARAVWASSLVYSWFVLSLVGCLLEVVAALT